MSALPARQTGMSVVEADALETDALSAIDTVCEPDAAEALLGRIKVAEHAVRLSELGGDYERRWGRVRLLAERRYGELLPPKEPGKRTDLEPVTGGNGLSGAERKAQHEARAVADVPEPVFLEYVQETAAPSRAGLLREADKMAVHYSSATDEWATPQDFFDFVAQEFDFTLDVCALPSSAKCDKYFGPEDDGLSQNWTGTCWMNPPYGDEIVRWVEKAHDASQAGATVVCLVPARVDTGWWWEHCRHAEIRFLRGRLKFGTASTSAPFPSALVIFGRSAKVVWWDDWR